MLGHDGKIRKKDGLLFLRAEALVRETHVHLQRRVIGEFVLLRAVLVDFRLTDLEADEFELEFLLRIVDDGREFLEKRREAVRNERPERCDLWRHQVWHRDPRFFVA